MTESHYCVIHKTPFFKKGNMKAYAHPIKDENGETTGWCNEPKGQTKEKQWGGKSPEEIKSIETQVAIKAVVDLLCADKLDRLDDRLLEATENWLLARLVVKPTATAVKDTAKEPAFTREEVPTGPWIGDLVSETELSSEPITAEQKERLKELQEKLPGRALQLIKKWGWGVTAITKLTEGQAKHLIEEMEEEEPLPLE